MTTDQLRAYLDAHGVDGEIPAGVFCVVGDQCGGVGIGAVGSDGVTRVVYIANGEACVASGFPTITRHAPLPDFAAAQAEIERLRSAAARRRADWVTP